MRPLTRPGLLIAIAVAVVALPTVASGALSSPTAPTAVTANSTSYQDSSGENPAAPDITTLTVSNTDAGLIQFRVNIPNRAQLGQDMLMLLFVDTDANPDTGDPESVGADYVIQIFGGEAALFRWDGSDFTRRAGDPPATSLIFSYQGGVTVTMSAAELGNTKKFGFAVIAISGVTIDPTTGDVDFTNAVADVAPASGAGLYQYEVKITPPTLVVKSLKPTPEESDGRALVHAPARRGTLGHGRGRAERPGHVCRTCWQRTTQGSGSACAGRGGDLHVEPSTLREGPRPSADRWRSCSRA